MTFFDGLYFFIALFLGCVPAIVLGLKEKPIEKYLMFFSIIMILLINYLHIREKLPIVHREAYPLYFLSQQTRQMLA